MIGRVYDRVSRTYDSDWRDIYRKSRQINIQQITRHIRQETLDSATDLAVGTGNAFRELSRYIAIERQVGNDISSGMLGLAKEKLGPRFISICDDVVNIDRHVPENSQDLVLCHFLFSYVHPDNILKQAYRMLKPGGYFSIASSTQQALAEIHRDYFPFAGKLLAVNSSLSRSYTPHTHQSLCEMVTGEGFELVEDSQLQEKTSFKSFRDVAEWGLGSGWAAQYFDRLYWLKMIGVRAWFASARLVFHPLYPVVATNDISLLLARKPE